MTTAEAIRVLVVDDHPVVREGLLAILGTQPDIHVVGEAATAEEALALVLPDRPDVAVVDIRLPGISGIELSARLRARWPETRVVIFTSYALDEEIHEALSAGAWAYVRKGVARSELLQAIRAVHGGERHISPEIGRRLAERIGHPDLSAREREVLKQVQEGQTNKDIAKALDISEHTVNLHVKSILNKLGAGSRTEAVTVALRKGILHLD